MLNIGAFARLGQVSPRTLRRYDHLGLLQPDHVDPDTGYRSYRVAQLARLHTLLALRDLGFSLEQIGEVLRDEPPVEELRGMLRLRHAQLEQILDDERDRLRRVEAHLLALEGSDTMAIPNVVIKTTQPLRIAAATAVAPGFGHANLGPIFGRLVPEVIRHMEEAGITPGMMVAFYGEPHDDGCVVVHAGFDVGDQVVADTNRVNVIDLPIIEVASVVHQGPMTSIEVTYEALVRWIDDSGYRLAGRSRELYLEWHNDDSTANVTELQMPIAR